MPTRPSTPYRWGTNAGARVAPSLARQGTGWAMNEPIDPLQCNDLWGQLSDWVDYLADVVPASNVFEAEVFRVVDPAGPTTRGALTWDTIGGNEWVRTVDAPRTPEGLLAARAVWPENDGSVP